MNQQIGSFRLRFRRVAGSCLAAASVLLVLIFMNRAEGRGRGSVVRSTSSRSVVVDRSSHGSVRHVDTHVVNRSVEVHHDVEPRRPAVVNVHQDVDVDVHFTHPWNDFRFGLRNAALPLGFLSLRVGAVPYFYSDGIYYQTSPGGYQEVYPPVGAIIPQLPDGAIQISAGGLTYYYAGGAFYTQQPDGTFAIAPTPLGVVVPELPPGAIQVSVNGGIAYQFNGIYYEPVFVNGVTQYETFQPQQ